MRPAVLVLFAAALASAQSVTVDKQVAYSGRTAMDIARPTGAGPFPAVVAIHGGGFTSGDRAAQTDLIQRLAAHGYVAAAIDYRLAPATQFPSPVQDVKAAVRFLRANAAKYAIDPNRIAALGESAGGTLALLAAFTPGIPEFDIGGPNRDTSSRINCAVAINPLTDLARVTPKDPEGATLPAFLGGDNANVPHEYRLASPISWVTPAAPPVLVLHGATDSSQDQARRLVDTLKRAGAPVDVTMHENGNDKPIFAFLDRQLGLAPPQKVVLVADHGGKLEVAAIEWPSGRELWAVPNRGGHDVQPLPGGNVLYTIGPEKKVIEMDRDRKPVWTYGPEEGLLHPISAERLPNGNTLIGDAQAGKVIEVDKDRKIVWTYASPDLGNMRMRNSRRTAAGTTLIAIEAAAKIIEVNQAGEIVWTYTAEGGAKRRPYRAVRLANGNTLISLTAPGELIEVDRAGKILRSIAGEKNDIRMIWASGYEPLPNGNVLLNDYLGHRILEIGTDGKVIHEVRLPGRNIASIAMVP